MYKQRICFGHLVITFRNFNFSAIPIFSVEAFFFARTETETTSTSSTTTGVATTEGGNDHLTLGPNETLGGIFIKENGLR